MVCDTAECERYHWGSQSSERSLILQIMQQQKPMGEISGRGSADEP